jgi:hypothetical protein
MKKNVFYTILAFIVFSTTSCSKYLQSGNGGFSDVSLNRTSDEYSIKRLKQIDMDGNAICGIPGIGAQNNKNKNKSGLMFRFNGIEIGRTSRIFPIITMLGFTAGYTILAQTAIKNNNVKPYPNDFNGNPTKKNTFFNNNDYYSESFGKLRTGWALILGLPFAGATNNLLWNGVAASGLTNQVYYKLVDENPDVDVFVNPKYKVDYHPGIFTQKAHVILNATGATLKMK